MFQHGETIKNMSKKQLTYIDFIVLNSVNPLQNQEILFPLLVTIKKCNLKICTLTLRVLDNLTHFLIPLCKNKFISNTQGKKERNLPF